VRTVRTLLTWTPRLLRFGLVQVSAQGLMFLAGLVIIRGSDKAEYAAYTLATSAVAVMANLSSSGITGSVLAIGGRIWRDEARLRGLIAVATTLRWRLFGAAALCVVPILAWSLWRERVPAAALMLVTLSALGVTALQAAYSLRVQALRLRGELPVLQRLELVGAAVRLFACVGAAAAFILKAPVAVAMNGAGVAVQLLLLGRHERGSIAAAAADRLQRAEIIANVRRQIPNEIYYALSSQLTLWLLAAFGSADAVAHFGALGRIAVVFGVLGSVLEGIVIPAYVKMHARDQVIEKFVMIVGAYCAVAFLPLLACALFPGRVIAILGPQYQGLESQFLLIVLSATLGAVNAMTWSLNAARGWIMPSPIFIAVGIGSQVLAIALVDVHTVTGAVEINLANFVACIGANLLFWFLRVRRLPEGVQPA